MSHNHLFRSLLLLMLLCFLPLTVSAGEETEIPIDDPTLLNSLFGHSYLACDTIPADVDLGPDTYADSVSGDLSMIHDGIMYKANGWERTASAS